MADTNSKQVIQKAFSYYSKGEMKKFLECLDSHITWNVLGEHPFKGSYRGIQEVVGIHEDFSHFLTSAPKRALKALFVEGEKGAVFFQSDLIGKDGKQYKLDHWFIVELSKDGHKIAKIDNYVDSLQLLTLIKANERFRLSA